MTYKIYEGNFDKFDKKMQRIIKKSVKYPECNIKYEVLDEVYEERKVDGIKDIYKFIEVDVEGTVINNGWRFIATLERISDADRNVIRQADTSVEIQEKFYTCELECEHCHQKRHRKDTYIVYNEETKEFKQVGKTCLMEYTKGLSAEAVATLNEAVECAEGTEHCFSGEDHTFYGELQKVLKYAEPLVRMQGYIPVRDSEGEYNFTNTRDEVYELYSYFEEKRGFGDREDKTIKNLTAKGYDPEKADKQYIQDALDWIMNTEADSTYINNLKVVCSAQYIDMGRDLGLAVSLFSAYYKELQRREHIEIEKKQKKHSKFVGEIGDKISFIPATKRILTSYETIYGIQWMYQFTDEDNNVYIWRTSAYIESFDDAFSIKGTVKDHRVYNGIRQTELTRCRVVYDSKEWNIATEEEIKEQKKLDEALEMFYAETSN